MINKLLKIKPKAENKETRPLKTKIKEARITEMKSSGKCFRRLSTQKHSPYAAKVLPHADSGRWQGK